MIDNDKMWASIISCLEEQGNYIQLWAIRSALKDQGLQYNSENRQIEEIDAPKFKIEAGKWYMCIFNYINPVSGLLLCKRGEVYKALKDDWINGEGGRFQNMSEHLEYFRPATPEEIYGNLYVCVETWKSIDDKVVFEEGQIYNKKDEPLMSWPNKLKKHFRPATLEEIMISTFKQ